MLRARIYSAADTFHYTAEVTPYDLDTLHEHLRRSRREGTRVSILVDPADRSAFARYTSPWLARLARAGLAVTVGETPPAVETPRGHAARRDSRSTCKRA